MSGRFSSSSRSLVACCTLVGWIIFHLPYGVLGQTAVSSLRVRAVQVLQAGIRTPVKDVSVRITEQDTLRSRVQVTDEKGEAFFGDLEPGAYEVRVTHASLRQVPSANDYDLVTVGLNQQVTVELPLVSAAAIAQIETARKKALPTGAPLPSLTVSRAEEGTFAQRSELLMLPNINNDLTPLLQVVPGAITTGPNTLGKVIIDGKGKDQQTFKLDGVDSTPLVDLPSGDAAIGILDSFQKQSVTALDKSSGVKSGAFEARYGPSTGSVTDSNTQTGRKDFAYETYYLPQNDAFNARNFFDYEGKNALRRSQFGGKLGGPFSLRKPEAAVFFLGYEGIRGRTERNLYEAIPADLTCGCASPLLTSLLKGFLPQDTAVVAGASTDSEYAIARRRVRTTSASNAWDLRLDFYPFAGTVSKRPDAGVTAQAEPLAPRANDSMTLRFTRQAAEAVVPEGVLGRLQRQRVLMVNALAKAKLFTTNYTHIIWLGVNETRALVNVETPSPDGTDLSQSLVSIDKMVKTTGLPKGLETVPVATLGGLVKGLGRSFDLTPVSFILGYDGYRFFRMGTHELWFGAETRLIHMRFDRLGGMTYAFRDTAALRAGTPSTVSLLSDLSAASPFSSQAGPRHVRQEYYMGYVQVRSKIKAAGVQPDGPNKLVVTYGLRYDYFGAARERNDRAVVVNPLTGEMLPPGAPFYKTNRLNLQPRVGVEYLLPFASGPMANTILGGSVGMYSGVPRVSDLLLPIDSDRFSTGRNGGAFPTAPDEIMRDFQENPLTRQYQPLAFSRDFSTPERAYKWEVSLRRKLRDIFELKAAYRGTLSRHLPVATIANPIVGVETNADPAKPAVIIRQLDIVRGDSVFKPFGEFFYRVSSGQSNYNALTVSLKGDSSGRTSLPRILRLSLNAQYTLSRNVGNASGTLASDPVSFNSDFGYNAADARHSALVQAIYSFADLFNSTPSSWLGGWRLSTSISARSGLPLLIRLSRPDVVYVDASGNVFTQPGPGLRAAINTPGGGATGGARVPDLLPGINPYLRKDLELLNPAAFAIPRPGSFGNLKRGALRGPSSYQVDVALQRRLFNHENTGIGVDFKIEAANLFNHANFNNPTATLPNALPASTTDSQLQPGLGFTRATAGTFGVITAADPGRQIQVSLTFRFKNGFLTN